MRNPKLFIYILEDKYGNEIVRFQGEARTIKEAKRIAKRIAKIYAANSNQNNLYKIVVMNKNFKKY
jgi:hypothetical protein